MTALARFRVGVRRALSRPAFLSILGKQRLVLCLHDVSEPSEPSHSPLYSTRPDALRRHIEVLSRHVDWVPLDRILDPTPARRPLVSITFDDGFLSVKDVAMPILETAGIPFSVFVCRMAAEKNFLPVTTRHLLSNHPKWRAQFTELLATSNEGYGFIRPDLDEEMVNRLNEFETSGVLEPRLYLTPEEIQVLHGRGVMIGSHSATHRVLGLLDAAALEHEIAENARFLDRLGISSPHFALPFGKKEHYGPAVLSSLKRHGYSFVYTTNPASVGSSADSPRLVPRISVAGQSTEELSFSILRTRFQRIDL